MSNFLDNLKKAVESGEFNSEAAKKINEIGELDDKKLKESGVDDIKRQIGERLKDVESKTVSDGDVAPINSEYEKQMELVKKQDAVNKQLATLIEIEDMVKLSIGDMLSFVEQLEDEFEKEFESENPMFGDLFLKVEEIKSKYNSIINN